MQKYLAREREFMSRKYCKRIQRQRPIQKKRKGEKEKEKKRRDKNFEETTKAY